MKNGRRNIRGCLVVFPGARHYGLFIPREKFIKQMIGELSYDRFLSIATFGNELRMSAEPQGPLK